MMHTFNTPSARWQALVAREASADGVFVYCVRTTGIYCRPVCKSRLARRANVEFFDTPTQAETAGYRACKRCRPELASYTPEMDKISKACAAMLDSQSDGPPPKLDELARHVGLTKFHFHRSFKRAMGITPREFMFLSRNDSDTSSGSRSSPGDTSSLTLLDSRGDNVTTPPTMDSNTSLQNDEEFRSPVDEATEGGSQSQMSGLQPEESRPWIVSYTAIQTKFGVLLVAFLDGQLCKLDLSSTLTDALSELRLAFAAPLFDHAPIDATCDCGRALQDTANALYEALERPSGKMVYIPYSLTP
ncbi:hypothetical protein B0A54_03487 [Friedmanniomyces endolithicus]|uniref:HTH araC/xylS-type domain-containing protein n=1 Tax=Friedmanniomyces endolithicus TaxID=329885 RepID=A0A4U0VB85_9PEZI|nr:hypothetical protein LTS09_004033 [Friedmanniomyces endolithicus]TKA45802.1 hypothetical protein B0A54_03487 [Friedmanniomyces endolithicus]